MARRETDDERERRIVAEGVRSGIFGVGNACLTVFMVLNLIGIAIFVYVVSRK